MQLSYQITFIFIPNTRSTRGFIYRPLFINTLDCPSDLYQLGSFQNIVQEGVITPIKPLKKRKVEITKDTCINHNINKRTLPITPIKISKKELSNENSHINTKNKNIINENKGKEEEMENGMKNSILHGIYINVNYFRKSGELLTFLKKEIGPFTKHSIKNAGRIITTIIEKNKKIAINNIYALTGNHTATNNFITNEVAECHKKILKKRIKHIIYRGDWNAMCDGQLDRWSNFTCKTNEVKFESILNFMETYKIKDVWHLQNKNIRQYIWARIKEVNVEKKRENTEISNMRMDMFLTTINVTNYTKSWITKKILSHQITN